MSIKIRLARTGKKSAPTFKVVASQTHTKRNGKFLDILGHFNPAVDGKPVINKAKVDEWVKKGALVTDSVRKMLDGSYKHIKYSPKIEKPTDKVEEPAK